MVHQTETEAHASVSYGDRTIAMARQQLKISHKAANLASYRAADPYGIGPIAHPTVKYHDIQLSRRVQNDICHLRLSRLWTDLIQLGLQARLRAQMIQRRNR
jgi:hypothetical protein